MENNVNGLFYQQESNMFDMRKTGARISQLRRAASLTQAELAEKLGISYQAVSSWERGSNMPDIGKLLDLARILNTTVDALLSAQEPAAPVPEKEEAPQSKSAVIEERKKRSPNPRNLSLRRPILHSPKPRSRLRPPCLIRIGSIS